MGWKQILGIAPPDLPKEGEIRYAKFSDRLFASAIDLALAMLLFGPLFIRVERWAYGDVQMQQVMEEAQYIGVPELAADHIRDSGVIEAWLMSNLLVALMLGVVYITCWYAFQTTPGKFIIGMRIVDVDTQGKPSLLQLVIRYAVFFISIPPLMLGFVWAAWDKRKQAWHDKLADTAVIYTRKGLATWFHERMERRRLRAENDNTKTDVE